MQVVNTVRRYSIVNAISDSFLNVETIDDGGQRVPLVVVARDGVPVNWNFETSRVDPSKPTLGRRAERLRPAVGTRRHRRADGSAGR